MTRTSRTSFKGWCTRWKEATVLKRGSVEETNGLTEEGGVKSSFKDETTGNLE